MDYNLDFRNLMKEFYSGYATHQLVLIDILKRINKPMLELGAGDYSTPLIHDILKDKKIRILTLDHDKDWLNKYEYLRNEFHDFKCISNTDIQKFYDEDSEQWGLVFIDYGTEDPGDPWRARINALLKYSKTADYIILHDCDALVMGDNPFGETIKPINIEECYTGIRNYNKIFKYWIEFFVDGWQSFHPPVLLASNKICLDNIKIDGMIISNESKCNNTSSL
jgi:hypothetical protein